MTLELTQTPANETREYVSKLLNDMYQQERELYSRQEVENMLLDIYSLLRSL